MLLNFDGADDSTTFTDLSSNAYTITAANGGKLGTEQFKFGTASGDFTSGTTATAASSSLAGLSITSNFTLEAHMRFSSIVAFTYKLGVIGTPTIAFFHPSSTQIGFFFGGDQSMNATVSTGVWYHVAVARSGTALKFFLDGVVIGSQSNSNTTTAGKVFLGSDAALGAGGNCWIDNFRYTRNRCEYTAAFTPPAAAFPTS